jgi:hypothetical protein
MQRVNAVQFVAIITRNCLISELSFGSTKLVLYAGILYIDAYGIHGVIE